MPNRSWKWLKKKERNKDPETFDRIYEELRQKEQERKNGGGTGSKR